MSTYTIQVRGHGRIWQWSTVTEDEMQQLLIAMGASPDGVDDDGRMFVEFKKGIPRRDLGRLSPEVCYDVLRRPAIAWREGDPGPNDTQVIE